MSREGKPFPYETSHATPAPVRCQTGPGRRRPRARLATAVSFYVENPLGQRGIEAVRDEEGIRDGGLAVAAAANPFVVSARVYTYSGRAFLLVLNRNR